jgi:hypothetical protein
MVLYILTMASVKTAILLLYSRVFQARNCHRVVWTLIAITVLWGAFYLATLFTQCPLVGGTDCLDLATVWYTMNGLNVSFNVAILLVPVPFFVKLQLSIRNKTSLCLLLLAGLA